MLGAHRRIGSADELAKLIDSLRKAGRFALQCHTANGKSVQAEIIGLSFCLGPDDTAYVEVIDPRRVGNGLGAADGRRLPGQFVGVRR